MRLLFPKMQLRKKPFRKCGTALNIEESFSYWATTNNPETILPETIPVTLAT